jgi:hypothetical protein
MNAIYLRRRLKVVLPAGTGVTGTPVIAALQKNLEGLGFILAPEVCEGLAKVPAEKIGSFYKGLVADLKEMVGEHKEFRPLYPNFPEEVMATSAAQLYWNAIIHYCTNRLLPVVKRERTPLLEETDLKIITLGTRDDFEAIFTRLASSKTSLSAEDKADMDWFIRQYRDDILRLLPDAVPVKENLAVIGAALLRNTVAGIEWLAPRVGTATDVLRIAVAMNDGDVSLAEPAKFGNFPRRQRALLLSWIERCSNATEDMLRWKGRWIRLGERLHPGDYASRFPRAFAAFAVLRNDEPFTTFNARVEQALEAGDGEAAVALLASRPGELTRRLDHLLRTAKRPDAVIEGFRKGAAQVASPLLLQAMTHFQQRDTPAGLRTFFPKGDVGKVQAIPDTLPPLPAGATSAVAGICEATLVDRFAKLPSLGACYLDPRLKDYLVPFSQRSAAKALRTLIRGSRLPLPECRVLRMFLWWRNGSSRTDIDLSAALYDGDFNYVSVLSYYNLKELGGCHSGDIVDAPDGAAEFIDIDVAKPLEKGVRYVVMSINSYTMQPYCDLPECFAGWMARNAPGSGEIFEARTVKDRVDIASNTRICLPAIFDLVEKRVIWADIALRNSPYWNNVQENLSGVSLMLRAILGLRKPTLFQLFSLHLAARGRPVGSVDEADTVFSVEQGITPFDFDRIVGEFL